MDIIVFAITNILPVLVVTYVSYYFMKQVYKENSKYSSKLYFGVWSIFAVFYMLIIQLQLGSIIMTVYGIVSMQIISLFYCHKRFKTFYNLLFYLYLMILDLCSIPLISIIFNTDTQTVTTVNTFKIRKLTPKECWRLMGFRDECFDRAKAETEGISDSQLYKQAGNSIVINVLYYIFLEIFKKYIVK